MLPEGFPRRVNVGNLIGEVRLCGVAVDPIFRSQVNLSISNLQPDSPTALKRPGFLNLPQSQNVTVKMAGSIFRTGWDRYLRVMEAANVHRAMLNVLIHCTRHRGDIRSCSRHRGKTATR
ncbi:MAG: hypothetical protein NVS4B2_12050 [Chloroflexota bacterium]